MKKSFIFTAICCIATIIPAVAQNNVQKAFDALIKSSDVKISETHSLEKDSSTGVKESQCDIYDFTIPAKRSNLIDNIVKAFRSDEDQAYSISSGLGSNTQGSINLAIGDGNSSPRVNVPGRNYIYACYLAPKKENPSGKYRYAYAINWVQDHNDIHGTLMITYATTLKYRQNQNSSLTLFDESQLIDTENTWFSTFMCYVQAMGMADDARIHQAVATKMYKKVQSAIKNDKITREDKDLAREILKGMCSTGYDSVTLQLLKSTLNSLK